MYEDDILHIIHTAKIDYLKEMLDNIGENVLIAYNYKFEKELLLNTFKDSKVITDPKANNIELWNENKIKIGLIHPASGGHGLNLQFGGSTLIWFGFNWSLELYQQLNKRLHRNGQKNITSIIHLALGAVEYMLLKKLSTKEKTQNEILNIGLNNE